MKIKFWKEKLYDRQVVTKKVFTIVCSNIEQIINRISGNKLKCPNCKMDKRI